MKRSALHFAGRQSSAVKNPFRLRYGDGHARFPYSAAVYIFVAGFLGILYGLFLTPVFAIERVDIQGTVGLSREALRQAVQHQLQGRRWHLVSQRNILALDTKTFEQELEEQFAIADIKIKKDHPHTIVINVVEQARSALWSARGKLYALDGQGVITGEVQQLAAPSAAVIYDKSAKVPVPKEHVLAQPVVDFVIALLQNERIQALHPQFLLVEEPNKSEIELKVGEGWRIYFDTSAPLSSQLQNLDLTLRNTITPDARKNLEYIDLRFGERVYYKMKGE